MIKISSAQLANFVVSQLEAGIDTSFVAQKLAAFLLECRQSRDSVKIMRLVETELDSKGINQVSITSLHTVSQDIKTELANLLGANNPVFSEVIDPSVIGGVKAHSGENQLDLTVAARLNKFRQSVVEI